MQWNLSISAQPVTPGNKLVAAIYQATTPLVLEQKIILPEPYTGDAIQIVFLDVDPVVYNFILWENADGSAGGINRNHFALEPTNKETLVRADMYLIADSTPGFNSGGTQYLDDTLKGWGYDVERVGTGTMFPALDYNQFDDGVVGTGTIGWGLAVTDDVIQPEEKFVIHFYPQSADKDAVITPRTLVTAVDVITNSVTLLPEDAGRAKAIEGAVVFLTVTLPAIPLTAEFKPFTFYSRGGSHACVAIKPASGDAFDWPTQIIYLNQNEQLKVYRALGRWFIDYVSPDVLMVGGFEFDFAASRQNRLLLNGAVVSRTAFTRLFAWLQTQPSLVVAESAWTAQTTDSNGITYYTNLGKFTMGNGSTTFRIPKLIEYGYVYGVGSGAGSTRGQLVGAFSFSKDFPTVSKAGSSNIVGVADLGNDQQRGTKTVNFGPINPGQSSRPISYGLYPVIKC
jgi:hypothetical protein